MFTKIRIYFAAALFKGYLRGGGGGWTPYNGLYGEAPPGRGTFFTRQVFERVGISRVEVYEVYVIWVFKRAFHYFPMEGVPERSTICQWKAYEKGTFSAKNGI